MYEYSRPGEEGSVVEERELGPDGDLVASMISTAVIPMICKLLEGGALDVYSLKHTRRVIDLCEEIEASVEEGNLKFQVCFSLSLTPQKQESNIISIDPPQICCERISDGHS